MPSRKERRQAAHKARKLARKAGFPITTTTPVVAAQPEESISSAISNLNPTKAAAPVVSTILDQMKTTRKSEFTPPRNHPSPNAIAAVRDSLPPTIINNQAGIPEPGFPFPSFISMATPRQQEASRINGSKSRGALTPETRAISAQNHTTHGLARHQNGNFKLLPFENEAAFKALEQSLLDEHQPATQTELILVHEMAESQWLAQRSRHFQDACFHPETGEITDDKKLSLYMRYHTTHTRAFNRCLNDLLRLRREKRQSELGFEAQRVANERHQMKKDLHYWKILEADMAGCTALMDLGARKHAARQQNPNFEAEYNAELEARGLKQSFWETATRVA